MSEPLRPIPCVRSGCGHDTEQDHRHDTATDDQPCMVDGCGCPGAVYDDNGLFQWLRQHDA